MSERRKGERNFLGSRETPYSKGLMARALTAVGVREDDAYELARRTELDLAERSEVSVDLEDRRYTKPLKRDAGRLANELDVGDAVVLLGSIATPKYLTPLKDVLGDRLRYPEAFVGLGDMSRGSLMLRCAAEGRELAYVQPS